MCRWDLLQGLVLLHLLPVSVISLTEHVAHGVDKLGGYLSCSGLEPS